MTPTDTTIATTGVGAIGVETNSGGVTSISGGSVSTAGQDAHSLVVAGAGSTTSLSGGTTFTTQGAGAIGICADTRRRGLRDQRRSDDCDRWGRVADDRSRRVRRQRRRRGIANQPRGGDHHDQRARRDCALRQRRHRERNGGLDHGNWNAHSQDDQRRGGCGGLQGNGASVLATGGGSIVSAGTAIAFLGGTNQTATFDNFNINNQTGDLIFADPSFATINFSNTVERGNQ